MTMVRVAAWQYPIEQLASFDAWRAKLEAGIAYAAERGAELCVLPEYASMELTSVTGGDDLASQLDRLQPLLPAYNAAHDELARRYRVAIVGGSFPERIAPGEVRNRLRVHAHGRSVAVDKLQMTRFERERWHVGAGRGQTVIELGALKLGVVICYDAEFPLLVRRLVVAGANVIVAPSCTDTAAGYHRVRVGCQARALENQCYVVQVPTVGLAPWSIAVDENVGAAGVYAPCDRGFPDDGVIAVGPYSEPAWLLADLDLAALDRVRAEGQVFNHRDWDLANHLDDVVTTTALA